MNSLHSHPGRVKGCGRWCHWATSMACGPPNVGSGRSKRRLGRVQAGLEIISVLDIAQPIWRE